MYSSRDNSYLSTVRAYYRRSCAVYHAATMTLAAHASIITAGLIVVASQTLDGQGAPVRIDTAVALAQVAKRVEPMYPPDAVTANPGAVIAADVVVRVDGTVESVRIVTGPQAFHAPVTAALQQWSFKPFLSNGRPVRAVVMVDFVLSDPVRDAERKAADAFFAASVACEGALARRASDVEPICRGVVALSERLEPSRVIERARALEAHGIALLMSDRPADALKGFDAAIEVRRRKTAGDDADLATLVAYSAQALVQLGNLEEADRRFTSAVAMLERAIKALPGMRANYEPRLATVLELLASVKAARGQTDEARALAVRGAAVPPSLESFPLPPIARDGSAIMMGPLGPSLTPDDLRQLRAFLPTGKKAWLFVGTESTMQSTRRLIVEVFVEPDRTLPTLRRGHVITAEAVLQPGAPLTVTKTWTQLNFQKSQAQVLLPGREPADVRGNDDLNRPAVVMTTIAGDPPSDDELVSLITFIRAAQAKPGRPTATGSADADLYVNVQPWPIETIASWQDHIEVRLLEYKTVATRGQKVKLSRQNGQWTIIELRAW